MQSSDPLFLEENSVILTLDLFQDERERYCQVRLGTRWGIKERKKKKYYGFTSKDRRDQGTDCRIEEHGCG